MIQKRFFFGGGGFGKLGNYSLLLEAGRPVGRSDVGVETWRGLGADDDVGTWEWEADGYVCVYMLGWRVSA